MDSGTSSRNFDNGFCLSELKDCIEIQIQAAR